MKLYINDMSDTIIDGILKNFSEFKKSGNGVVEVIRDKMAIAVEALSIIKRIRREPFRIPLLSLMKSSGRNIISTNGMMYVSLLNRKV